MPRLLLWCLATDAQVNTQLAHINFVSQNVSCVRRWDKLLKLVSLNRKVEKVTKSLQNDSMPEKTPAEMKVDTGTSLSLINKAILMI